MRVISGQKRGKKLETLKGDAVRPTTDKVKESVFNIIQFDVVGSSFLDLFAGSGQIGIEALSRGACTATFVDVSKDSINVVKKNLVSADLSENAVVMLSDALRFLKITGEKFDIAFLDPPYNSNLLKNILPLLPSIMSEKGIIICEYSVGDDLPADFANFQLSKVYKYGKIALSVYRVKK